MKDEVPTPTYKDLMTPTISALRELGGSGSSNEIYDRVIKTIGFSTEVLSQTHGSRSKDTDDPRSEVEYQLAWARTYLKKDGWLNNSKRGVWVLTAKGMKERMDPSQVIKNRGVARKLGVHKPVNEEADWKEGVFATMAKLTPAAFERLMALVLRESGFSDVRVTGKTGDGGIDGYGTYRSGLLSTQVVFQCKRYNSGSVGASTVRDFKGSMDGHSSHGLLVTNSRFTAGAREAASKGSLHISLIDGDELTEELRRLEIGFVDGQFTPTRLTSI